MTAMMGEMIERVHEHDVTRLVHHDVPLDEELPVGRQHIVIGRAFEGGAPVVDRFLERGNKALYRRLLILSLTRRRTEVEFVLIDDECNPRRHRRDEPRETQQRHRLRVGCPVVFAPGNTLQCPARPHGFAFKLIEKQLSQLHANGPF